MPAFGRMRQEDHQFEASLNYVVKPHLKLPPQKKLGMIMIFSFFPFSAFYTVRFTANFLLSQ
jgi:hypothetical protein